MGCESIVMTAIDTMASIILWDAELQHYLQTGKDIKSDGCKSLIALLVKAALQNPQLQEVANNFDDERILDVIYSDTVTALLPDATVVIEGRPLLIATLYFLVPAELNKLATSMWLFMTGAPPQEHAEIILDQIAKNALILKSKCRFRLESIAIPSISAAVAHMEDAQRKAASPQKKGERVGWIPIIITVLFILMIVWIFVRK